MHSVTRRVVYSGRVQGVGFRARTHQLAQGFDVVGFVRNLPDGDVELVVTATPLVVEEFLEAIRVELGRWIVAESIQPLASSSEGFRDFSIRH